MLASPLRLAPIYFWAATPANEAEGRGGGTWDNIVGERNQNKPGGQKGCEAIPDLCSVFGNKRLVRVLYF